MLGLANGISATLYCSLVTAPAYRFAVYGTKGSRRARDTGARIPLHAGAPSAPPTGRHTAPAPEIIEYKGFNALAAELEGFAAAINGERPYPITAEEVLHGVAAFEAIVRSAALHQPVKVAHPSGRSPMPVTVLYPEERQIPDDGLEAGDLRSRGPHHAAPTSRPSPTSTPPTAPRSTG